MRYAYPVILECDEDGEVVARSRDVPDALTSGRTKAEALREMSDALGAALAGYALEGREIPPPRRPGWRSIWCPWPPLPQPSSP